MLDIPWQISHVSNLAVVTMETLIPCVAMAAVFNGIAARQSLELASVIRNLCTAMQMLRTGAWNEKNRKDKWIDSGTLSLSFPECLPYGEMSIGRELNSLRPLNFSLST